MTDEELEAALEARLGVHRERIRARQREVSALRRSQPGYLDAVFDLAEAAENLLTAEEQIPKQVRAQRRRIRTRLARVAGTAVAVDAAVVAGLWFFDWVGLFSAILLVLLALAGTAMGLFADDANPDTSMAQVRAGVAAVGAAGAVATIAAFGGPWPVWSYAAAAVLMTAGWNMALGKVEGGAA
jgi:hypothetical protein